MVLPDGSAVHLLPEPPSSIHGASDVCRFSKKPILASVRSCSGALPFTKFANSKPFTFLTGEKLFSLKTESTSFEIFSG